jgi:putative membrane protein
MPFFFVVPATCSSPLNYRDEYATLRLSDSTDRTTPMKFVSTIVGFILFVLFFGFALKNTQEVDLHFFLNYELRGPLVLMLLAFFVAGAGLGILAVTPTVFRHRRESSQHKDTIQALQSAAGTGTAQPQPDAVNYK